MKALAANIFTQHPLITVALAGLVTVLLILATRLPFRALIQALI